VRIKEDNAMTILDIGDAARKFAEERSHRDAGVSNENARATGQAAILINGGAATAMLAFLAKDKIDPNVLKIVSGCLIIYAVGVLAGAGMLFSSAQSLDQASEAWRLRVHPILLSKRTVEKADAGAYWWWRWMRYCFIMSMSAFVISSSIVAWAMVTSTPPQQILNAPSQQIPSAPPSQSTLPKPP
jgi:hypothetical protein